MTNLTPDTPEGSRARVARMVARILRESALFVAMLAIMWSLFAFVLPRFGINT
ncbi:MAG: hypothetical protein ACYC7A_22365 [Thermoanaerobaculia bacterium]